MMVTVMVMMTMWGMNINTRPVVINLGGFGLVKKGMERYKIPGNIKIQQVQKCVLLRTANILRRSLSIK